MAIPLLISFYTKNTIYEKEVEDLKASCEALGIESCIEAREDLGSWDKNCCQKPLFILECMEKYKRPLLWVDADGIVMQKITLTYDDVDLALYFNDRVSLEARSATIYIGTTPVAKDFVLKWYEHSLKELAKGDPLPYGDQSTLIHRLRKTPNLKIGDLPLEYVSIFDRDKLPMNEIAILHFQASRTALMPRMLWEHISGKELKAMRIGSSSLQKTSL
jgi:hypothetical protein